MYSERYDPPALVVPISVKVIGSEFWTEFEALVDTGADVSAIPDVLHTKFDLLPFDYVEIETLLAESIEIEPTYRVSVRIAGLNKTFRIEAITSPEFILGRDILNRLVITADGPNLEFELRPG